MEADPKPRSDPNKLEMPVKAKTRQALKKIAEEQGRSVEDVAAEALEVASELGTLGLDADKTKALAAYRNAWISIGKLAELMDMHVLDVRDWLNAHGIPQNNEFEMSDIENA